MKTEGLFKSEGFFKKTAFVFLMFLLFLQTACKKHRSECQPIMGQYEWLFSVQADPYSSIEQKDVADRFAVVIEKRKIIFYKNGNETDKYHIREMECDPEEIESRILYGPQGNSAVRISKKEFSLQHFPYKGYTNYFYKVK